MVNDSIYGSSFSVTKATGGVRASHNVIPDNTPEIDVEQLRTVDLGTADHGKETVSTAAAQIVAAPFPIPGSNDQARRTYLMHIRDWLISMLAIVEAELDKL